ncbi:MAG: hypothetical protein KKF44_03690 [Nanoarchaeota archaeon]|nr:hypothetical protein [Nanoarchaeota archaeon]
MAFFLILFISLDFLINITKAKYGIPDIPFDSITVGSLTLTYFYGLKVGIILVPFAVLTQLFVGLIKLRHFLKLLTLTTGLLIVSFFSYLPIFYIVPVSYAIRYTLDYISEMVFFQNADFSRLHVRIINVIICYLILRLMF